ncbi:MAG: CARDB domain-containing protein [Gemmatimonadales bacterium]
MLAVLVACKDQPADPSVVRPHFVVSDGAHDDPTTNPDFFFLPPMVASPSTHPNFDQGAFNPSLKPEVQICRKGADNQFDDFGAPCSPTDQVALFTTATGPGGEVVGISLTGEHYHVNWHTDQPEFGLVAGEVYRVRVFVASEEQGFADVTILSGGAKNAWTNDDIPLQDGRTLPIRFRIEDGALCDPPGSGPCASKTINGAEGGEVVLETGDRIIVPPQDANGVQREFTLTLQLCNDEPIDVDLPTFGNCLRATVDPPLGTVEDPKTGEPTDELFSPFINVLVCSLDPLADPDFAALSRAQEDLVTLYRQDEESGDVFALPKSVASCPAPIGSLDLSNPMSVARAGWRAVQDALAGWLAPRPAYASAVVLNTGGGGDSPFMSKFQLALPAKMTLDPATNNQTADVGSPVSNAPAVIVTDADGAFVAGATVHFEVVNSDGSVTPAQAVSGANGRAALSEWRLGSPGSHTVKAFGKAIADPGDPGPFMPDLSMDLGRNQAPIPTSTGEVFFTARAEGLTINFDTDPGGNPVTSGSVVNSLYASQGVTFTRTGTGLCGTGNEVYANGHGPLPDGGFGVRSGNNSVTVCPDGVASDFSENAAGRIEARFAVPVRVVCIDVAPTGFQGGPEKGAFGFLEALDASGALLTRGESRPDVPETICASATGIASVQFAGAGDAFAIFDDLSVSPRPGAPDLVVTDVTFSPADPTDADLIFITQEFANVGTATAEPPIGVGTDTESDAFPGREGISGALFDPLGPDESAVRCCIQVVRDAGTYVQITTIDHNDDITESDETNNSRTDTYTVSAAPRVIFEADFDADEVGGAPGTPIVGTWSAVETAGGTVTVETGLGDVASRLVVLTRTQGGALGLFGTIAGRPPTGRVFVLRFRAVVSDDVTTGPATVVQILSSNNSQIGFFSWDGPGALKWNGEDTGVGWTPGVAQLLELTIGLGRSIDRRTSLIIDGAPVPGFQDLPFLNPAARDIHRIILSGGDAAAGFDDIAIVRQ